MKSSLLFGVAAGAAALIAGSFFYFWLASREERWVNPRQFKRSVHV